MDAQATVDCSLASDDPSHNEGDDSGWGKDGWPVNRCLPFPKWGCQCPGLNFASVHQYQTFHDLVTHYLHQALDDHCYDSLSNFIVFCQEYKNSREKYPTLLEFYREYVPALLPGRFNCVGLATDLASRLSVLEILYPGVVDATYQVSCEDNIESLDWYCSFREPPLARCVKDHVLLCIKIIVSSRSGVVLLDPAFHISQPITVMEDGLEPQSSVIKASTTRLEVHRTFEYRFRRDNPAYVFWDMIEKREGKPDKKCPSLIYVCKPYLSSVDVAERCNLVYHYKSLLRRNSQGHLISGLYFRVRDCQNTNITFFHQVNGEIRHLKHPLSYFLDEASRDEKVEEVIKAIAAGTDWTKCDLRTTLVTLARLLQDKDLVQQVHELNNAIHEMCT